MDEKSLNKNLRWFVWKDFWSRLSLSSSLFHLFLSLLSWFYLGHLHFVIHFASVCVVSGSIY